LKVFIAEDVPEDWLSFLLRAVNMPGAGDGEG
jgi:hypothetical protein